MVGKAERLKFTDKARAIVHDMTLEEKVRLMGGTVSLQDLMETMTSGKGHYNDVPYPAGGSDRHGLAPMLFCDGPRGVVCGMGESTCFPVSMCRGATFDTALEEEIGHAIGREVRAYGGNLFAGVCINLPYNPGWGRSQESYGEESFALGQFGAALVRGVQAEHVMACVKHYAFNSMEISRFKCSVDCDRRTEREIYLSHFKDCVDAGAASIMSAYNLYMGVHCGHHDYLLRKVLKEEWDFDGFVMSDFIFGVKDTLGAANHGQDMEMCCTQFFGEKLVQAVNDGLVAMARVDESAMRIVRTILAFEASYAEACANGAGATRDLIGCDAHAALALRAAQEGITLLKNDASETRPVLPFDRAATRRMAVVGKLAAKENIGDHGSSQVYPKHVVTPIEGLKALAPDMEIVFCDGSDLEAARSAARAADAVLFVVGFDHDDEGEYISSDEMDNYTGSMGGDRKNSLGLHADEIELIRAVGPENANSAVAMIGGNTIMMTEWMDCVSAILMAYYPGQAGGTALAQILFGDVNPSGKLPYVLPVREGDLPQVNWNTTSQFYDYWHGYAKLEKEGVKPLRPYGFGLSYTTFEVKNASFGISSPSTDAGNQESVRAQVGACNSAEAGSCNSANTAACDPANAAASNPAEAAACNPAEAGSCNSVAAGARNPAAADSTAERRTLVARCTVRNTGAVAGTEVVQLYAGFRSSSVSRPVKLLRGFARVDLQPGEEKAVEIVCPVERLKWYNPKTAAWELERMTYEAYIGTSADDRDLLAGRFEL